MFPLSTALQPPVSSSALGALILQYGSERWKVSLDAGCWSPHTAPRRAPPIPLPLLPHRRSFLSFQDVSSKQQVDHRPGRSSGRAGNEGVESALNPLPSAAHRALPCWCQVGLILADQSAYGACLGTGRPAEQQVRSL